MNHRSSISQAFGGGRASPYAPRLGQQDRSFSDLFEYVESTEAPRKYEEYVPAAPFEDDDAPDMVHVKHMGDTFSLKFPAYSISESGVTVQEVRKRVADRLKQDPRKIRLVYKDRELRFDPSPIKRYGCKQNSEIGAVITSQPNDYGGTDNHHSSGDDSGSVSSLRPTESRRPRGLSSVRHRSDDGIEPIIVAPFLHPNHANGYTQYDVRDDRRSVSPGRQRDSYKSSERTADPPRPAPSPRPRAPSADPNSPMGKVQALQTLYYEKWLPEAQQYLGSPPSDAVQKDREYRRISESIMKHIIEAADAIELQGDVAARTERKSVLSEASELLKKLDAVQGGNR